MAHMRKAAKLNTRRGLWVIALKKEGAHLLGIGRFKTVLFKLGVPLFELRDGPHRVIELAGLKDGARVPKPCWVSCSIECDHGDLMHPEMIGVTVSPLILGVGEDHLRTLA